MFSTYTSKGSVAMSLKYGWTSSYSLTVIYSKSVGERILKTGQYSRLHKAKIPTIFKGRIYNDEYLTSYTQRMAVHVPACRTPGPADFSSKRIIIDIFTFIVYFWNTTTVTLNLTFLRLLMYTTLLWHRHLRRDWQIDRQQA